MIFYLPQDKAICYTPCLVFALISAMLQTFNASDLPCLLLPLGLHMCVSLCLLFLPPPHLTSSLSLNFSEETSLTPMSIGQTHSNDWQTFQLLPYVS